jgi:hypothetical protein
MKAAVHCVQDEDELTPRNPIFGRSLACCALAASGHAAAPPSRVMN